jgi:predicted DNA-binding transcriptional regulator YafY
MRADRLLSLLMLLQRRGRLTADQLARELEVSARTIYRDLDALSGMGVPVYAERGPGGGCGLLDGYRTTLTGLTPEEVRALFMLSVPAPLAQLGVSAELRNALLKLTAAAAGRSGADAGSGPAATTAVGRIYVDSVAWFGGEQPAPHLQTLYRAVQEDLCLWLTYRLPFEAEAERLVEPLGLVAKAGAWNLVYARDGQTRVVAVSQVLEARPCPDLRRFARPAGFDLEEFWIGWCKGYESRRPTYPVRVRLSPAALPHLRYYFGERAAEILAAAGPPDEAGWVSATLVFEAFYAARERILGLGGAVEVLEPLALRLSIADFARQAAAVYGQEPETADPELERRL